MGGAPLLPPPQRCGPRHPLAGAAARLSPCAGQGRTGPRGHWAHGREGREGTRRFEGVAGEGGVGREGRGPERNGRGQTPVVHSPEKGVLWAAPPGAAAGTGPRRASTPAGWVAGPPRAGGRGATRERHGPPARRHPLLLLLLPSLPASGRPGVGRRIEGCGGWEGGGGRGGRRGRRPRGRRRQGLAHGAPPRNPTTNLLPTLPHALL